MDIQRRAGRAHTIRLRTGVSLLLVAGYTGVSGAWSQPATFAETGKRTMEQPASATLLDILTLGNPASEKAHALMAEGSDTVTGGLGESARRLLPSGSEDVTTNWEGGRVSFTIKVDPEKPNYITVRLWGDDISENKLILYIEGKQVGYRHLGDIEILDLGGSEPGYNRRFFYRTTPLPLDITRGKSTVRLEIRSTGRIWGYGQNFAQYQKTMTAPTRGIYRIYTHTDGYFVPPADEKQGKAPANPPRRTEPGREEMERLKDRVSREIEGLVSGDRPLNQMQMQFLARAYHVKWAAAYRNEKVIQRILAGLDHLVVAYRQNPDLVKNEPATPNPDWFGFGPSGDVLRLLADQIRPVLNAEIPDGSGGMITRRAAYAEILIASRDWHRKHRRMYTNQSMIIDMYSYLANRGIAVVDPAKATAESQALRYLYESVGLEPWRGSDGNDGSEWPVGNNYWQLTAKGLTKELGYVGNYGEVLDWVTQIYEATRPAPDQPGDAKIKAQLVKIARARAAFRAPALDAEGYRAMRLESVVGWRDTEYPGNVVYAQRTSWDGSPLEAAAATLDPYLVGYAQQMFVDNQFFASIRDRMKEKGFRVTAGLLSTPDQYDILQSQSASPYRLPMAPGQPDYTFADEENGVVAIKHGDDILYVSLYWRARNAVNFLARVHYTTPLFDRIAIVRQQTEFEPSGLMYTRPDWTNFGFGNGGLHYPGDLHSAHAGEQHPIAKLPEGIKFKPGDENVHAGKGSFYTLRYGPYLIGMNCTRDKTFSLAVPEGRTSAPELKSGKVVKLTGNQLPVGPLSTVVLYLGGK